MSFVKCFDVVSMVVDEATDQFSPLWVVNKDKYDVLKQYCGVLDNLAKEFDGESFEVEVDDIAMTITISMECKEMTIETANHQYYSLAQRSTSFGFSVASNGNLVVQFTFPSVWSKS